MASLTIPAFAWSSDAMFVSAGMRLAWFQHGYFWVDGVVHPPPLPSLGGRTQLQHLHDIAFRSYPATIRAKTNELRGRVTRMGMWAGWVYHDDWIQNRRSFGFGRSIAFAPRPGEGFGLGELGLWKEMVIADLDALRVGTEFGMQNSTQAMTQLYECKSDTGDLSRWRVGRLPEVMAYLDAKRSLQEADGDGLGDEFGRFIAPPSLEAQLALHSTEPHDPPPPYCLNSPKYSDCLIASDSEFAGLLKRLRQLSLELDITRSSEDHAVHEHDSRVGDHEVVLSTQRQVLSAFRAVMLISPRLMGLL